LTTSKHDFRLFFLWSNNLFYVLLVMIFWMPSYFCKLLTTPYFIFPLINEITSNSPRIFQIGNVWVDQRTLSLSMNGYTHV
jgi:hypothetical protein